MTFVGYVPRNTIKTKRGVFTCARYLRRIGGGPETKKSSVDILESVLVKMEIREIASFEATYLYFHSLVNMDIW